MNSVKQKVSYLKGYIDGLHIDSETKEGKVIKEITDILQCMADEICFIKDSNGEIKEYIEQIDNDLINVEDEIYGLSEELIDEGCEYNDDDFQEMKCPSCNESIFIDKTLFQSNEHLECPNCRYNIILCSKEEEKTE